MKIIRVELATVLKIGITKRMRPAVEIKMTCSQFRKLIVQQSAIEKTGTWQLMKELMIDSIPKRFQK